MTQQDKTAINRMRLEGHTPSKIAIALGLPAGTVRSYIHRHPTIHNTKHCKNCGKPVLQSEKRREKKFCSDRCRMAWWNTHQDTVNRKAYYNLTCKYCGKEFKSYGNKNRKYCCRACYVASRQAG
ncbi:MAG: DUF2116 family Zn-ribbon domain-containing protein [Clostridia bacterium]|nr:DUF2116 family Zn-ribbon domain-containing protein [Clostridia bacterium]